MNLQECTPAATELSLPLGVVDSYGALAFATSSPAVVSMDSSYLKGSMYLRIQYGICVA